LIGFIKADTHAKKTRDSANAPIASNAGVFGAYADWRL
jgi:hypothetical protein